MKQVPKHQASTFDTGDRLDYSIPDFSADCHIDKSGSSKQAILGFYPTENSVVSKLTLKFVTTPGSEPSVSSMVLPPLSRQWLHQKFLSTTM